MTPLVISILNYRTADLACQAAASVLDDLNGEDAALYLIDNASGDGSSDVINAWVTKRNDPRVTFLQSDVNTGFAGGHNMAFAADPNAAAYLLLNSDAVVQPGFWKAMKPALDRAPKTGLAVPRLSDATGGAEPSLFRFHSPMSEVDRAAASRPVTRVLQRFVVPILDEADLAQSEWVSFACVLLSGDMVRDIGVMDDGYFLYFEDVEYGLRARRAGWGHTLVPEAHVVHIGGASGTVETALVEKTVLPDYYWRARTRFFRQAYGPLGPTLANLGWIAGRLIARLRLLTGRTVPPVTEGEWRRIWTGWANPLQRIKGPGT